MNNTHPFSNHISSITRPFSTYIDWISDNLKNLKIEDRKELDSHIPTPSEIACSVINFFFDYHKRVIVKTERLAELGAKFCVVKLVKKGLFPLRCCKIGKALQHSIAHDILGNLAKVVVFCALQVFHFIPYKIIFNVITKTLLVYRTDPYTLTASLAGGMLLTNIWFIYRLIKTVESSQKKLEKEASKIKTFIDKWNFFNKVYKASSKALSSSKKNLNFFEKKLFHNYLWVSK